jgi:hypothetical protein
MRRGNAHGTEMILAAGDRDPWPQRDPVARARIRSCCPIFTSTHLEPLVLLPAVRPPASGRDLWGRARWVTISRCDSRATLRADLASRDTRAASGRVVQRVPIPGMAARTGADPGRDHPRSRDSRSATATPKRTRFSATYSTTYPALGGNIDPDKAEWISASALPRTRRC